MANWAINLKMKSYMPLFFKKCCIIENPWQRTFCVNTNCLLMLAPDCLGHFGTGLVFFLVWRIKRKIYWLIHYLLFHVPLRNSSLIRRRHHYQWRAAKFRPMLGAQGLWAGRDFLSSHTCCDTGPRFFSVSSIGPPHTVTSTTCMGMQRTCSNPDLYGYKVKED
jgi:hypothetical protein